VIFFIEGLATAFVCHHLCVPTQTKTSTPNKPYRQKNSVFVELVDRLLLLDAAKDAAFLSLVAEGLRWAAEHAADDSGGATPLQAALEEELAAVQVCGGAQVV
jgi:hypothetical protein